MLDNDFALLMEEMFGRRPVISDMTRDFLDSADAVDRDGSMLKMAIEVVGNEYAELKRKKRDGMVGKPGLAEVKAVFWKIYDKRKDEADKARRNSLLSYSSNVCPYCRGLGIVVVMACPPGWKQGDDVPNFWSAPLPDNMARPENAPCPCSEKKYTAATAAQIRERSMPITVPPDYPRLPGFVRDLMGNSPSSGAWVIEQILKKNTENLKKQK